MANDRERKGPGAAGGGNDAQEGESPIERMRQLAIKRRMLLHRAKQQLAHSVQPGAGSAKDSTSMSEYAGSIERKVDAVINAPDEKVGAMDKGELKNVTGLPADVWAEIEPEMGDAVKPNVAAADFTAGGASSQFSSSSFMSSSSG